MKHFYHFPRQIKRFTFEITHKMIVEVLATASFKIGDLDGFSVALPKALV